MYSFALWPFGEVRGKTPYISIWSHSHHFSFTLIFPLDYDKKKTKPPSTPPNFLSKRRKVGGFPHQHRVGSEWPHPPPTPPLLPPLPSPLRYQSWKWNHNIPRRFFTSSAKKKKSPDTSFFLYHYYYYFLFLFQTTFFSPLNFLIYLLPFSFPHRWTLVFK